MKKQCVSEGSSLCLPQFEGSSLCLRQFEASSLCLPQCTCYFGDRTLVTSVPSRMPRIARERVPNVPTLRKRVEMCHAGSRGTRLHHFKIKRRRLFAQPSSLSSI